MPDELEILRQLLPTLPQAGSVVVGPGDDCAALEWSSDGLLLAAVDQLIGGVHYFRESTPPRQAGRKLLCRNLSDIAAMGGYPFWALLTVASSGRASDWVLEFCRGVSDCGREYGVSVVGGDIASLPVEGEVATLTILGMVRRSEVVRRSGASPGDWLYVTGELGNSLASGHHLDFSPRLAEGRFLAERHYASAMLDVSDGLLLDARRLAESSGVRLLVDPAKLPLRQGADCNGALTDGEDYELLFTVSPERAGELEQNWNFGQLTRIGVVESGSPDVTDPDGNPLSVNGKYGYEH